MTKILIATLACLIMGSSSDAAIAPISLGGGGGLLGTNTLFINTGPVVQGGSTFDAQFQIVGSGNLDQSADGIGVVSTTTGLNPGDDLVISFVGFTSGGGSIVFDGFTSVELGEVRDVAGSDEFGRFVLSSGVTFTRGSNGPFSIPLDPSVTFEGVTAGGVDSSFRAFELQAQFSAVPEPSSMAALAVLGAGVVMRRRRR